MRLSKYIRLFINLLMAFGALSVAASAQAVPASWQGVVRDGRGNAMGGAQVELSDNGSAHTLTATTDAQGAFRFLEVPAGNYAVRIRWHNKTTASRELLKVQPGDRLNSIVQVAVAGGGLVLQTVAAGEQTKASGGQQLSSRQVSALPLNKRDFSQLLLLAAGTMTDTNGSANFTQQFAVNGQRGATAMFAMDGVDTTDPELGGATFSNFNIDAVQGIQSLSGVIPAEIGHGAAGFTNILTKSGTNLLHGSVFEFVRNSAFDARNFFDRRTLAEPGRIPPFRRNEFGFALGGPVTLPGIYRGRDRTYFFGQYQGFRQVLSATEVLSVPTQAERQGVDTTAFPGDTLFVPINPQVAPMLAAYPEPNDPQGSYGPRTFATSSRVSTETNQFSLRLDHRLSDQGRFFARFNLDNTTGPLTNPDQTVIDPTFAIAFHDHQRNQALKYTRTVSPHFTSTTSLGYIRSTPLFISPNKTQPSMIFADSLYEPFNSASGIVTGAYGNLFQLRQDFLYVRGSHSLKFGAEIRFNRDTTVFGVNPDGTYTFGGGPAYAPADILSASGQHDLQVGDRLPDSLAGFLTGTPFSYSTTVASALTARGDRFDEANIRREAYNFYFQDSWKVTPRLTLNYGLRYEFNTQIHEGTRRTSNFETVGSDGKPVPVWEAGARQILLVNPQPPYGRDLRGWGPRLATEWRAADHTVLRAGGGITTILPNLWYDNFLTGGFPFMVDPTLTALPGVPVPFANAVTTVPLPSVYTVSGQPAFPSGRTNQVSPNTPIDVPRYQADLSALTPGNQPQLLSVFGMDSNFRNGYIGNYTAGIEQTLKDLAFSASYVATAGVHLASAISPNSFTGASPEFAHFTQFNSAGQVTGGFGPEFLLGTPSHSTYHALQVSASKNSPRLGLGFQTSYTLSKSLDDTSAVVVNYGAASGTTIQAFPQDPWNPGADKGPSTFDMAQVFTTSAIEALPLDRVRFLQPLGTKLTSGWQVLNITTLATGSPFSVYSGIQQTGVGSSGSDRPDQIAVPEFSTRRTVREDYFGRGDDNPTFFSIPIDVAGGTGPNQGRFGTLGRNTFRGPGFTNLDMAVIKDTSFGSRANSEPATLEFRGEFFNAFNLVTFGLPVNILRGSGFGVVNHTAGTSRQIQFSLKLIY
ncbi:MAG: carboxypeptidase regulatory-like domain-containing protein [Terriglobia bacterium]